MITCIVVDDDRSTTKVFSDILELMGLQVIALGYSGSEAVCLYKMHHPDVAFIDMMMPKTDGFYALKKIRQFDPIAKVVAVTADLSLDTHEKLREMKITAIICKPFDQNEIKKVLIEKCKIRI